MGDVIYLRWGSGRPSAPNRTMVGPINLTDI